MNIRTVNLSEHPLPSYETGAPAGMALKKGISPFNTPGTMDADYHGEIKLIVINLSQDIVVIEDGECVAQMIISRHEKTGWIQVEELKETKRGAGGYGHTGTK